MYGGWFEVSLNIHTVNVYVLRAFRPGRSSKAAAVLPRPLEMATVGGRLSRQRTAQLRHGILPGKHQRLGKRFWRALGAYVHDGSHLLLGRFFVVLANLVLDVRFAPDLVFEIGQPELGQPVKDVLGALQQRTVLQLDEIALRLRFAARLGDLLLRTRRLALENLTRGCVGW